MRRAGLSTALALLLAGCASQTYEQRAHEHSVRADRAAAVGDYQTAAREQDKAERLRLKALGGPRVAADPNAPMLPPPTGLVPYGG